MTMLDSTPIAHPESAQALIEEARRRQRRRWWAVGVLAALVALSGGAFAVVSGIRGGGTPGASGKAVPPSIVGLLANSGSYQECPGSAQVGRASSPDGLPAKSSRTDDLAFVTTVARNMESGPYLGFTHRVAGLPDHARVTAIRVGPGGGFVWSRTISRGVEISPVKNYGIYLYLGEATACPSGGWARWADNGVQVTFLAPKR